MAGEKRHGLSLAPETCLAGLPEIPLETSEQDAELGMQRAELRRALLSIAELDHVSETAIVRSVVKNVLGRLPSIDE